MGLVVITDCNVYNIHFPFLGSSNFCWVSVVNHTSTVSYHFRPSHPQLIFFVSLIIQFWSCSNQLSVLPPTPTSSLPIFIFLSLFSLSVPSYNRSSHHVMSCPRLDQYHNQHKFRDSISSPPLPDTPIIIHLNLHTVNSSSSQQSQTTRHGARSIKDVQSQADLVSLPPPPRHVSIIIMNCILYLSQSSMKKVCLCSYSHRNIILLELFSFPVIPFTSHHHHHLQVCAIV